MAKKVRALLAGCGGISGAWLGTDAVKRRVEIVALVDMRREAAQKRREEFGLESAIVSTDLARRFARRGRRSSSTARRRSRT